MAVKHGSHCPCIPFVDAVSVRVKHITVIKMRACIDRAVSIGLGDISVPENHFAVFIGGFHFQPDVKSVNCAGREGMPDISGADDDIDARIFAARDFCCSRGVR